VIILPKVFLGGTCNESTWRKNLISALKIDYFNPVVDDWNEECRLREIEERENCDFCLYVITPLITGFYSIAEVVDDSNKRPNKTLFCVLERDKQYTFSDEKTHSLEAVKRLVESNGVHVFNSLRDVALFLNHTIE
jgi:hypothetical protein